jgi:predicted GNAT family N-acyltransferase
MFHILIYSESNSLRAKTTEAVTVEMQNLAKPVPWKVEPHADRDDRAFAERVAELSRTLDALIVISDRFPVSDPRLSPDAHGLASLLRECSSYGRAITALLAVVDIPVSWITYVDGIVNSDADDQAFREAFRRILRAIHYKLPPPRQKPATSGGVVEVLPVETIEDFQASLSLRYEAYGLLGYFHETMEQQSARLELDYYDQSALHLVAVAPGPPSRRVIGTARLVLARTRTRQAGLFGSAVAIRAHYTQLCERVAAGSRWLMQKLEGGPGAAALPLFASFGYGDISPISATEIGDFCELSRVVVSEKFRGMGISRLLVRACVAAAIELGHRYVVLECIPQHVRLYAKMGFEKIGDVKHRRAWGVDQLAVVMRLDLQDTPYNIAVQLAKKDAEMMAVPRQATSRPALCLCRNLQCWGLGAYDSRGGRDCPLRASFVR